MTPRRQPIRYHGAPYTGRLYTALPTGMSRDTTLTSSAAKAALVLWSHSDGFETGRNAIRDATGMSEKTVTAALNRLEECRWLVRAGGCIHLQRERRFTDAEVEAIKLGSVKTPPPTKSTEGEIPPPGEGDLPLEPEGVVPPQSSTREKYKKAAVSEQSVDHIEALLNQTRWTMSDEAQLRAAGYYWTPGGGLGSGEWRKPQPAADLPAPDWFTDLLTEADWSTAQAKHMSLTELRSLVARAGGGRNPVAYARHVINNEKARPQPAPSGGLLYQGG